MDGIHMWYDADDDALHIWDNHAEVILLDVERARAVRLRDLLIRHHVPVHYEEQDPDTVGLND